MQQGYRTAEYRQQEVMGASPLRVVVMTYDLAIRACEARDYTRATRAVSVLRDALNFDYGEASIGLFKLYQWCLDSIREDDFESAISTLKELRAAWITTEKRLSAPAYAQVPQQQMQVGVAAA